MEYHLYYELYYNDYIYNDTDMYCELAEDKIALAAISVFAALCILMIIAANGITLIAVLKTQLERQKKQLICSIIAGLYGGLIGLPSTLLQLYKIKILYEFRWCLLSFGLADMGNLFLALSVSLHVFTIYLSIKYPLKSHIFQDAENKIVLFQSTFPVLFFVILMIVNFSFGRRRDDCCSWSYIPYWYYFPYFIALFTSITCGYIFASGMMCIARKQAIAINTIEMSREDPHYLQRLKQRNAKQIKVMKILVFLFTATWVPLIVATLLDELLDTVDLGDLLFYAIYFTVVTIGMLLPAIYSYTLSDVRSQLKTFISNRRTANHGQVHPNESQSVSHNSRLATLKY